MATILVIDDEFGIAELFEALLVDEGHRVLTAANGRRGLDVLATERPDLIFLDFMMPILDGAGVLKALAAVEAWRALPVVMMSSIPEEAVAQRCVGYAAFIRKPFSVNQVLDLVKRLGRPAGDRPQD